MKISRRRLFTLLGVSGVGAVLYSRFGESHWLGIGRHTVRLASRSIPKPIRILQLSDLHASRVVSLEFIAKAVRLGLACEPDLILLTGDFITGKFDQFKEYAEILATLPKAAPSFACLGNHDGGRWAEPRNGYADTARVRQLLMDSGIRLLHNCAIQTRLKETNFQLVGLGDLWAGEITPKAAFQAGRPDQNTATVVLSHNPDTKEDLRTYDWDVMFCGHTHGGQSYLPLIGTPFAPVQDKRFVKGLHAWEGRWIHITKGVGNLLGVRFNCRPEISVITLA